MKKAALLIMLTWGWVHSGLAQPCLSGWDFRVPVTIDNTGNGQTLVDYQIKITFDAQSLVTAGKLGLTGNDIRFLDDGGGSLPFWIEQETFNTAQSNVWVRIPNIPANSSSTIYMFYGNSSAIPFSDGVLTFDFFDEFNAAAISPTNWDICNSSSFQIINEKLSITAGGKIVSKGFSNQPHITELWMDDFPAGLQDGEFVMGQFESDEGYAMTFQKAGSQNSFRLTKFNAGTCFGIEDESSILSQPAVNTTGIWSFSWPANGTQTLDWPGGSLTRSNTDYTQNGTAFTAVGNIDINSAIKIEWVRTRKYTAVEPGTSLGSETVSVNSVDASNNGPLCEGADLTLTASETTGATYEWRDPMGAVIGNMRVLTLSTITGADAGQYTVTASSPGGCTSASSTTDVSIDLPTVAGTLLGDATVCSGNNSGSMTLVGNTGEIVRWESSPTGLPPWTLLDNTSLVYENLLTTTFYRVAVKNGVCDIETSNVVQIIVDENTIPGILSGDENACSGNNVGTITLSNNLGDIVKWQQSTNEGITWIDIPITDQSIDFADISLTTLYRAVVANGVCDEVNTQAHRVTVNPFPVTDFVAEDACASTLIQFSNFSTINSGTIQSYFWDFGDGNNSVSFQPEHSYESAGTFNVTLTATSNNQCVTSITKPITIAAIPEVAFDALQACDGFPTVFQNNTSIASGSITGYFWDFGDGTTSRDETPDKTYFNSGTYQVRLEATSDEGCVASIIKNVTVDQLPVANFDVRDVCFGEAIQTNNTSFFQGGTMTFTWDFGDGNTSTVASPSHVYENPGIYQIKLIARTNQGCLDSLTRNVQILTLTGVSAGQDVRIDKGLGVQLLATGAQSYSWFPFEGLNNPNIANPIASPLETTTYIVTATDFLGCTAEDSLTVFVNDVFNISPNNVMTPNGDGVNDTWIINNIETFDDAFIQVFDRNGVEVFRTLGYNNDWEGNRGNDPLPDGTYYYTISSESENTVFRGALTILRE